MYRTRPLRLLILSLVLLAGPGGAALADGCPLPCSGPSASPPDAKLLFAQPDGEAGRLLAYDTATRGLRFTLPPGRASADGRTFVAARAWRGRTVLERYATGSGRLVRTGSVRGAWSLAAVSPTGAFAVLARRAGGGTELVLLDARSRPLRELRLRGDVEVEAVSRDGRRLFLVEHLSARRYRVRTLDVRTATARELNRKGDLAPMTGYARTAVGSADGRWLLTLYVDTKRRSAFVHALDLVHARPLCIGVPSDGGRGALDRYSLKLSPDARTLLAANPSLGVVSEIDLGRLRVVRTVRFGRAAPSAPRASSTTAAISRDARTLYFSAGRDLFAYDRHRGAVRGPYATWGRVVALGFGLRDRRIHVLRGDGRLVAFDASTGRLIRRR